MDGLELTCFQIISAVGTARSYYIEAIQEAKCGNFTKANELKNEGQEMFNEGHRIHAELIKREANGEKTEFALILLHAEDLLLSAEAFGILADEFIDLYKMIIK
ncbi:MAG: PTS lactose/cellobiose transporter subunit IIA [Erysipelotrichaceae bacterium]|nr:PTS lactose/cellobiose transporter subunit IIA [Erysipelotrichaceae bacterium]